MAQVYDAIVIGAGIMGSAAAYHLSKAGQRVLVLEQFTPDHTKGSSFDTSRIIRYAYDHPAYVELAKANYPAWREFEVEAGETFYTRTGGIDFGRPDTPYMQGIMAALDSGGIPYELLSAQEAMERFSQFRLDDDMRVLYQADSGILAAARAVLAHLRLAQQHGATLLTETPVEQIIPTADGVQVRAKGETYSAARLIVSAGSWGASLLAQTGLHLPLVPTVVQVGYFEPENLADFMPECFPVFIAHLAGTYGPFMPYGIASLEGSGLKIGFHGGTSVSHPSEIDYTPREEPVQQMRAFMRDHIPSGDGALKYTRVCLYTMTPDEHFVIDQHPVYPQIIVCSPCSGHGFKFGTLIGGIVRDLALEGQTAHDISLFRLARFVTA